ncbi:MAG: DUF4249 domain-containing protein [Candidatus Cloacimonetes bacterium]|nr:DUF4249 domain-containing protein [Candidatus Cloacimonadota bacterium]
MWKNILILGLVLLLISCDDLTSGKRFTEQYYTLTGLLIEGETVSTENYIFLGRTIEAEGGNLSDIYIDDAQVKLINQTLNDTIFLTFFYEVSIETFKFGYYDAAEQMIINAGHSYRIEAEIPEQDGSNGFVWSETTIPSEIILNPDNDESFTDNPELIFPTLSYETANTEHPLTIQASSIDVISLLFQFYCLEDYKDAIFVHDFHGSEEHPETPEDYEHPQTGMPRKIKWFFKYQPEFVNNAYYIYDRGYRSNLVFYGRYEIKVLSIDENYYQYLYKVDGYKYGGIQNGYGYFGSASGGKLYTKVVN